MKKGARLIHAARGGIVCEAGLCEALTEGHLAGAALDVFEKEPLAEDNPLRTAPNLILTPHLGASTVEAKRNVSLDMANQIGLAIQKGVVLNGVNVAKLSPADALQAGPYMDLARNLASLLTQTFEGPLVSLRLSVQGGIPASSHRALTVAMIVGALRPSLLLVARVHGQELRRRPARAVARARRREPPADAPCAAPVRGAHGTHRARGAWRAATKTSRGVGGVKCALPITVLGARGAWTMARGADMLAVRGGCPPRRYHHAHVLHRPHVRTMH